MFLKKKWSRKIKERSCTDGHLQQEHITKEKSSSPTVALYTLMGSYVMDALDDRKVITVDIPGAFLQDNWAQDEHAGYIMFEGIMEMICKIDPSYYKDVIWSKDSKKKFLCGRLLKAVYGTLLGAIIFYNKLSKHLTDHRFFQNGYDMCVHSTRWWTQNK